MWTEENYNRELSRPAQQIEQERKEENTDSNLFSLSCSNFFLETSPKAKEARAK
uniref:Uncharacterized protein n=1 Tax=Mustela putorius furo TaxID=9669 RepID=M3YEM7_MUSPF